MVSQPVKRLALAVLPLAALLLAPTSAMADDEDYEDQPPPPPMNQPVYTAPLSQTTQTTYVPQSVALSGPEEINDFDPGRPIPAGYTLVHRTRKGLIIGGGATLGASYGLSVLIAAIGEDVSSDGRSEVAPMWIPVAGPFLTMANTDSATLRVFLAGIGVAQTTGAVLLYYGLTTKKSVLVRNDLVGSLNVTPMVSSNTTGLVLSGSF
jgi:hypothetical protein